MKNTYNLISGYFIAILILVPCLLSCGIVFAQYDSVDGPIVRDAKKALETGDVNIALKWVQKKDEPEVMKVFGETMGYRKLTPKVQELADNNFFEVVIRLNRAGNGAPYEGLKPAGLIPPIVMAADKSVSTASSKDLFGMLSDAMYKKLNKKFEKVILKRNFDDDNVEAGREYVKAYADLMNYVELISGEGAYENFSGSSYRKKTEPRKK